MSHNGRLSLPESEMTWRFSRSSGAGGQHVNTTDTRVELIWSLTDTTALSPAQKELASQRLSNRLVGGTITVVSSQYRSQHRNREAARVRLEDLVSHAIIPPKPRRATTAQPRLEGAPTRLQEEAQHHQAGPLRFVGIVGQSAPRGPSRRTRHYAPAMSVNFVRIMLVVAVVIDVAYWAIWFTHRAWVESDTTEAYVAFENAFPLADAWLGTDLRTRLRRARPTVAEAALLWLIAAGSAGMYLFCMDVLYDLQNGIYAQGAGGVIEAGINLHHPRVLGGCAALGLDPT